jgi:hypothetical protein
MLMDNRTLEAAMARFEELNNLSGLPGKVKKGGRQKTSRSKSETSRRLYSDPAFKRRVYTQLSARFGWTPREIAQLTPYQIITYVLEDTDDSGNPGRPSVGRNLQTANSLQEALALSESIKRRKNGEVLK